MSDPDTWPVDRPDDEDTPDERRRVFDDEKSGPRPGRDIEFREDGDRSLIRPDRRAE